MTKHTFYISGLLLVLFRIVYTKDIPIKYINSAGNTGNFEVVVFTKNFNLKIPTIQYCAWRVLPAQTAVEFVYPVELSIGASYTKPNGQKILSGPFPAQLGATWSIMQESSLATAVLQPEQGATKKPSSVVIKNLVPSTWGGNKYDVGIYKDSRLMLVQKDVHVGNQIDFLLQSKLYFGLVQNMQVGDTFTSLEIATGLQLFDLNNFPNGIEVTLNQSPDGQYLFIAEPMV